MAAGTTWRMGVMLVRFYGVIRREWRAQLDKSTIHIKKRWILLLLLLVCYVYRILRLQAFYICTYALSLQLMRLFISFISPQTDPEITAAEENLLLPIRGNFDDTASNGVRPGDEVDEFRPFLRQLPEFKFWAAAMTSLIAATIVTFIPALDIPAYWPLLVIYFLVLFSITMREQIRLMIKYKYIPISWGKRFYGSNNEATATSSRIPQPNSSIQDSQLSNIAPPHQFHLYSQNIHLKKNVQATPQQTTQQHPMHSAIPPSPHPAGQHLTPSIRPYHMQSSTSGTEQYLPSARSSSQISHSYSAIPNSSSNFVLPDYNSLPISHSSTRSQ